MPLNANQISSLLLSICWLGLFLIISTILRKKLKIFQILYLPASIIGGFILLLLSSDFFRELSLNLFSKEIIQCWRLMPSVLINIIFANLFLGVNLPTLRQIWQEGGPQLCYGWIVGSGQYIVGLLLTFFVLTPLFNVPLFFGCLLEIGFSGGHGTASGMSTSFNQIGYPQGTDLGLMSATAGIIVAVIFGMALINIAARKKIIFPDQPSSEKNATTFPNQQKQTDSISADIVDPLALHFALCGIAILIGWFLLKNIQAISARFQPDLFKSFPLFPLAMVGGLIVQKIAIWLKIDHYLQRNRFERITGVALDFLVISAIASLRLEVFWQNFWPFILLISAGVLWMLFATWYIAPRIFKMFWFERAITEFGMQAGVTAIGLMLLRVVDPNFKTPAAASFGFKQMIYEPFLGGGFITAATPLMIVSFGFWPTFILISLTTLFFILLIFISGWWQKPAQRTKSTSSRAPHTF